jgi:CAAX amino terminal protease family.
VRGPWAFLLLLQGGLLLMGASGMLLLGLLLKGRNPWVEVPAGLLLLGLLQGLEGLFARLFPGSFREAERLHRELGRSLKAAGLGPPALLLLALLSGVAEEVFFRGLLQTLLYAKFGAWGLLLQALLFASPPRPQEGLRLHPLHRGGGPPPGLAYLLTGSLIPGIWPTSSTTPGAFTRPGRAPKVSGAMDPKTQAKIDVVTPPHAGLRQHGAPTKGYRWGPQKSP